MNSSIPKTETLRMIKFQASRTLKNVAITNSRPVRIMQPPIPSTRNTTNKPIPNLLTIYYQSRILKTLKYLQHPQPLKPPKYLQSIQQPKHKKYAIPSITNTTNNPITTPKTLQIAQSRAFPTP